MLEVIRGKFPFDKLKEKIIEVKERYGGASLVIEEGGISHGLIQALREKHINVVDYKPKGDKLERLISQIDLFEGGSVLLPKDAPWLEAFVAELLSFRAGTTIRSTRSRRASPGTARRGSRRCNSEGTLLVNRSAARRRKGP